MEFFFELVSGRGSTLSSAAGSDEERQAGGRRLYARSICRRGANQFAQEGLCSEEVVVVEGEGLFAG